MKGAEKKRSPSIINQTKRFPRSERRDSKLQQENANKNLKPKETDLVKASLSTKQGSRISINDSNTGKVTSQVYEELAIHYLDDKLNGHCNDMEKEHGESDSETINDSVSSHGDENVEIVSIVPKKNNNNLQIKAAHNNTPTKPTKSNRLISRVTAKNLSDDSMKNMKVYPKSSSESSEGVDDKAIEEVKEIDIVDEEATSNGVQIGGSDDETVNIEEKLKHEENAAALNKKIEKTEVRIEKLEEELREVAALEISLYSVVPEHSNSAHKVHAPARRLSRLYIHACKHWSQEKRATIARNAVSGLVLVAKSCGNDVPRLSFWLSNAVVLREIVTEAFGNSGQSSSLTRIFESNGIGKRSEGKYSSSPKGKYNSLTRKPSNHVSVEFIDDWQDSRTFTIALEKIEAWIFSRIVESIWWQTLTPNMQSPAVDMSKIIANGKLLGPALGDPKQGSFSVNLWKNALKDALKRLCPIRAAGNECGCLAILARMVMEQCVGRLDVAMFNAILRESAHEIPTDPVSDPIVDPKVLPIPAGDLSFGSGAQLKNSVGNWSRWLTDLFGTNVNDNQQHSSNNDNSNRRSGVAKLKCFNLLNSLSDLLMLPKDMLMDRSIRTEVCPSITLPLLKRILCNFTPDEFCPDPVPGTVLEAVNAECIVERRVLGETASSFPYTATPITYKPPQSQFATNASIHKKGYASDEELEELVFPLTSIIEKPSSSPPIMANGSRNENRNNGVCKEQKAYVGANVRYELLREVWLV